LLQAGVYGYLKWTPAVFWSLSMSEYIAAMRGIQALNEYKENESSSKLSKQDVSELRNFINERK